MLNNTFYTLIISICFILPTFGQINNIYVETYYIADLDDLTNTTGGKLVAGSKTYRIWVDLVEGSLLTKMYGDQNHPLIFASTAPFYNNSEDGVTLGYLQNKARLGDNTVALDSWLTLGQVTKSGTGVLGGVPKNMDTNGSIIGGTNNDGGSASIITGLLKNNEPGLGIPLTTSDGMMPFITPPTGWLSQGFFDVLSGDELTIFGGSKTGNRFESNDVFIVNSGSTGILGNNNVVLLGQLTTAGELSFELNLQVVTKNGETKKYVARDNGLLNDEILLPLLKYPLVCGCQDPNFVEFSAGFACNDISKCIHPIVFGCTDSLACNYNSAANFNIESLCCYIGYCNDIDLEIICPNLPPRDVSEYYLSVYPNPVSDQLNINHNINTNIPTSVEIFDIYGKLHLTEQLSKNPTISTSYLPAGYYTLQISNREVNISKKLIKIN